MKEKPTRLLGIYLTLLGTVQGILYAYIYLQRSEGNSGLQYSVLDPKIWVNTFLEFGETSNSVGVTPFGLLTVLLLLVFGVLFILGRKPFISYILTELILGFVPLVMTVLWSLLILSEEADLKLAVTPLIMAFFFTLIPLVWAATLALYPRIEDF